MKLQLIAAIFAFFAAVFVASPAFACPLCEPAYNGDLAEVNRLLANGANPNSKTNNDWSWSNTPVLFLAAGNGHADVVSALLAAGVDPNLPLSGLREGETPLMWAASNGHADAVKILLSAGAIVDAVNGKGLTSLTRAASGGHVKVVKILLAAGANPNAKYFESAILPVVAEKGYNEIVKMLLAAGASPFAKDRDGKSALDYAKSADFLDKKLIALLEGAIEKENAEAKRRAEEAAKRKAAEKAAAAKRAVEERIAAQKQRELDDALLAAVKSGDTEEEIRLIDAGANPAVAENERKRVAEIAERKAEAKRKAKAAAEAEKRKATTGCSLCEPAGDGDIALINRYLDLGANVNAADEDGDTALMFANAEIAGMLIAAGANVNAADNNGNTALMGAEADKTYILLAANADVNAVNNDGWTALSYAVQRKRGGEERVNALLAAGASVDVPAGGGIIPMFAAANKNRWDFVAILIEQGADLDVQTAEGWTIMDVAESRGNLGIIRLIKQKQTAGTVWIFILVLILAAIGGGLWFLYKQKAGAKE